MCSHWIAKWFGPRKKASATIENVNRNSVWSVNICMCSWRHLWFESKDCQLDVLWCTVDWYPSGGYPARSSRNSTTMLRLDQDPPQKTHQYGSSEGGCMIWRIGMQSIWPGQVESHRWIKKHHQTSTTIFPLFMNRWERLVSTRNTVEIGTRGHTQMYHTLKCRCVVLFEMWTM